MVDKYLIQRLDDSGIIDKRAVLWWQLGFEGRRIYTEKEFNENLRQIKFETASPILDSSGRIYMIERDFDIWVRDNVPILIKNYYFQGEEIPAFISVKPMSHDNREGWEFYEDHKEGSWLPLSLYHQPHIRGVAIDETDRFLFWYPITFGHRGSYNSGAYTCESLDMPIMLNPVNHTKFYKNLIKSSWSHGRRAQKKPKIFDCGKEGFEIVPYFEFDPSKPHLMIYPIPLFEEKLDLPVLIKSRESKTVPEVLGVGYYYAEERSAAYYWELDKQKQRIVRDTLKSGLEAVISGNCRQ